MSSPKGANENGATTKTFSHILSFLSDSPFFLHIKMNIIWQPPVANINSFHQYAEAWNNMVLALRQLKAPDSH